MSPNITADDTTVKCGSDQSVSAVLSVYSLALLTNLILFFISSLNSKIVSINNHGLSRSCLQS